MINDREKNRKSVLIACFSDPSADPRPSRMVRFFSELHFAVDVLGYRCRENPAIRHWFALEVPKFSLLARVRRYLRGLIVSLGIRVFPWQRLRNWLNDYRFKLTGFRQELISSNYDYIVVQDLQMLPLLLGCKRGAKVVFDAREFYPKQNEESLKFRLLEQPERYRLCRECLPACDYLLTVSDGLAKLYENELGLVAKVFRSVPVSQAIPFVDPLRDKVRMVHHGAANRNRGLEKMIEIVCSLNDRFTLDFYLVGSASYVKKLKEIALDCPRIRFRKPVEINDIVQMLGSYDVGFFYVEPSTLNLRHCLPNKLFEFIQAKLAVVIGPSPDMAQIVDRYECGFVGSGFSVEDMVSVMETITQPNLRRAKLNSEEAAKSLCFEEEKKVLMAEFGMNA